MAARLTAYVVVGIVAVTFIAGLIVGAQRDDYDGPVDLIVYNAIEALGKLLSHGQRVNGLGRAVDADDDPARELVGERRPARDEHRARRVVDDAAGDHPERDSKRTTVTVAPDDGERRSFSCERSEKDGDR